MTLPITKARQGIWAGPRLAHPCYNMWLTADIPCRLGTRRSLPIFVMDLHSRSLSLAFSDKASSFFLKPSVPAHCAVNWWKMEDGVYETGKSSVVDLHRLFPGHGTPKCFTWRSGIVKKTFLGNPRVFSPWDVGIPCHSTLISTSKSLLHETLAFLGLQRSPQYCSLTRLSKIQASRLRLYSVSGQRLFIAQDPPSR
jgi:hypothetical protein